MQLKVAIKRAWKAHRTRNPVSSLSVARGEAGVDNEGRDTAREGLPLVNDWYQAATPHRVGSTPYAIPRLTCYAG